MPDRIKELEALGFRHTKAGMTNGKYASLYYQLDEYEDDVWNEFIDIVKSENQQREANEEP